MSKLLDLLAQQKQLEEQIKTLQSNEQEAKVMKFVEELEALRNKYGYTVPDFIDVVHSLHNVKTPAKNAKSMSENTPKAPKVPTDKWKVKIDGVDFILKKSKQGIASKAMKAKGFNSYSAFLDDLMKKNKVETFEALIDKLKAEKI
ncbi:hypothetical protein [Pseudomonas taiwanensis]|uniref:Uncharacterized protein n=1 Tax=Pseudomonas taiwanensis SJ9 TaxID=1388762 RepID=V7DDP7_9PSED|nr:hypothetical protein [Pseudomonas taiwanensis]HEJ3592747.1 hypothetical protein [Pseudomonas aeruginosa]ESW39610.1 hypothetical protein O164_11210 [Pseudomonas taiwanensis SJ9]HEJ4209102.1 hypothetical protein [Pseudomonas aeruginosa]HEJ4258611.1 hypothetical protein [Pseudomonas aeruginosa]HEJ9620310.1 hypothetical protein [Pseudomonas aeruginosa]